MNTLRLTVGAILIASASPALAGSPGVVLARDEQSVLIQKDVGSERWAISLSLNEDTNPLNVTGNVFRSDGGEPAFVSCEIIDVQGSPDDIRNAQFIYNCYGNDKCEHAGMCKPWTFLRSVTLPGRFFVPPE